MATKLSNEQEIGDRSPERRVEALVHELVQTINASEAGNRAELRDVAVGLLREEVELAEPAVQAGQQAGGAPTFNPFGIGIPLGLMGLVLVFLFPPVGLLMFAAAAVMLAWGVGVTLLARS